MQTIDLTVSDEDTQKRIANADTDVRVFYTTDFDIRGRDKTNSDGIATFEIEIGPPSNPGTFDVTVKVEVAGYATETDRTTFEICEKPDNPSNTGSQNNSTDK